MSFFFRPSSQCDGYINFRLLLKLVFVLLKENQLYILIRLSHFVSVCCSPFFHYLILFSRLLACFFLVGIIVWAPLHWLCDTLEFVRERRDDAIAVCSRTPELSQRRPSQDYRQMTRYSRAVSKALSKDGCFVSTMFEIGLSNVIGCELIQKRESDCVVF